MRRRKIILREPWDIAYAKYQREVQKNIDTWEAARAAERWAEYVADKERWGGGVRPSVPPVPGYDAAARRLGCEDQYEDDLRARYGDDF